jgi:hypothetical protein
MDLLFRYRIRSEWLTWLLSAGFVVSDSKEPGERKKRNNARVKHIKHMLSTVVKGGKAAYISFFDVCVLKTWVVRRCRPEATKDRRHQPHQFASCSITTSHESCRSSGNHGFKLCLETATEGNVNA